ncbi:MAG: hypothetical protein Q8L60_01070 [Gammaproteobacteria bacterium]|nr:hypothetical protein [Gammaproteobacteria bacterium]MDP2346374.1 hypothetical protein [Gammaproteobacteria bacterium]
MAQEIKMINPLSGGEIAGYTGFSWTTLFFGGLPALFRGHISAFFVQWIIAFCTLGISWLVFPFFYNSWHQKHLVGKGFVPFNEYLFRKEQEEAKRRQEKEDDHRRTMELMVATKASQ